MGVRQKVIEARHNGVAAEMLQALQTDGNITFSPCQNDMEGVGSDDSCHSCKSISALKYDES